MFWDYRNLSDTARWWIFISTVVAANAAAITLSAITSHLDPDGLIATTLIALSSIIVHILQVMSTCPRDGEFPQVRKVLIAFLIAASIAHAFFIVYLRLEHDKLYDMLSKLVCTFHGFSAEVLVSPLHVLLK